MITKQRRARVRAERCSSGARGVTIDEERSGPEGLTDRRARATSEGIRYVRIFTP